MMMVTWVTVWGQPTIQTLTFRLRYKLAPLRPDVTFVIVTIVTSLNNEYQQVDPSRIYSMPNKNIVMWAILSLVDSWAVSRYGCPGISIANCHLLRVLSGVLGPTVMKMAVNPEFNGHVMPKKQRRKCLYKWSYSSRLSKLKS